MEPRSPSPVADPPPVWLDWPTEVDRATVDPNPFARLGCRGFSYAFTAAPRFLLPFPQRVDLRFALHLPPRLSHPAAVSRALRRHHCRHVISGGRRAAAFALGSTRRGADGIEWYLYVLQSDLTLQGPPALRDYLRGWRKVLFAAILSAARQAGVAAVYLAPAEAVYGAARLNRGFPMARMPDLWTAIYDRTASDFGLQSTPVAALNIQSVPRRRPYLCDRFFRLTLPR